ncbi:MAG: hypothetical protein IID45_05645 [Planctomycetes bacterium]|nr:hypothetical protein [Planctomycetota bacterium]
MYVTGRRMFLGMVVFTLLFFAASRRTASAQGLIWKLPAEEKCTVVFEGKLKQTEKTDDAGPPIIWSRKLIIKSLKKMKGYYDNKEVDCRLLEISVITGENIDGQIETGPAGKRIYKILVPESKIVGDTVDADKIFVSMIPIARNRKGEIMGIRKIGNAKQQRIKSPALQVYPILTLLRHYRTQKTLPSSSVLTVGPAEAPIQIPAGQYRKVEASHVLQSRSTSSTNTATFYLVDSKHVPFGLARWDVTILHMSKDSSQSRDEFKNTLEYEVSMKVTKIIRGDAISELPELK